MGNTIVPPILSLEEAKTRWTKEEFTDLEDRFGKLSRVTNDNLMSKSAFENYVFPFVPKEIQERIFYTFQLQCDQSNEDRNNEKISFISSDGTVGKTHKSKHSKSKFTANVDRFTKKLDKMQINIIDKMTKKNTNTKQGKNKKGQVAPMSKVQKIPFISYYVTWEQFFVGMTVMLKGTEKEKIEFVWRLWDVQHSNSLTYYDMRQVISFLMDINTGFEDSLDDLLESLFDMIKEIEIRENEEAKTNNNDHNNNNSKTNNNSENSNKKKENDSNEKKESNEKKSLAKVDSNEASTKKEEKNENNETTSMRNNSKEGNNGDDDNNDDNDDDPYLNYPTVSFDYFYQWCKKYEEIHNGYDNNGMLSWLLCTFPPKNIEITPEIITNNWKTIGIGIDCDNIDEKNDFLILNHNENVNNLKSSTKFSSLTILRAYAAWMNIELIKQCNFGAFLDCSQFGAMFSGFLSQENDVIVNNDSLNHLFNAFDISKDSRVFFSDFMNVLSIIMFGDADNGNDMESLYSRANVTNSSDKENLSKMLNKMVEYCVITFGMKPKDVNQEYDIISNLLRLHNAKLEENSRPCLDEYNDFYYIVSMDWWEKYMQYLGSSFCCKNDGRLVKLERIEKMVNENEILSMWSIDNRNLIDDFMSDTFVLRDNLEAKVDYVGISPAIWNTISNWYGGGCAIRRSVIGIKNEEKSDESDESSNDEYCPYLELYPIKLFVHSKSNCETLDRQREFLENLKLEADYKRNIKDEMDKNSKISTQNDDNKKNDDVEIETKKMDDSENETIANVGTSGTSDRNNPLNAGDATKISHIYNNLYYQWDVTVSSKTPFGYIAELICKYDPLVASINMKQDVMDSENDMKEDLFGVSKMRFWNLHGEKSLVVKEPKRSKLKILSSSLSYAEYKKKMKKNKKLATFFQKKNAKTSKKGRESAKTIVKKQDPPALLSNSNIISDTDVKTNGYIYLEVMDKSGIFKGVKYQKTLIQIATENENEKRKNEANGDTALPPPTAAVNEEEKTLVSSGNEEKGADKENGGASDSESESDSDADEVNEDILSQGVIGLQNLGNTCYLNAAVQCLSHSTPLTQYFLSNVFVHEINKENFLGHGGRVAIAFAALLRALWNSKPYSNHTPRNLKALMSDLNPLFEGRMQHDSQEALQFLLEGIHQDLNRIKERPKGLEVDDSNGRRDEIVAQEAWDVFTKREQSVIQDLFMGQFRSTTKCLRCERENHKFDAYQMVSLPIPTFDAKFIHIIVFFFNPLKKPVKYSIQMNEQATMEHVIIEMSKKTGIQKQLLIPCHILRNSIYQPISLVKRITMIQLSDIVIFYEAPHWATMERKERNVYCAPPRLKPGMFFDVKEKNSNKWFEGEIVDMMHVNNWNENMQSEKYRGNDIEIADSKENVISQNSNEKNDSKKDDKTEEKSKKENNGNNNEETPLLSSEKTNDNVSTANDNEKDDAKDDTKEDENKMEPNNEQNNDSKNNNNNNNNSSGNNSAPWGQWKVKIHYSGFEDEWDEWMDYDDKRIDQIGKHVANVPSNHKYPILYQDIPYHVMTLKMVHRRLIKQGNDSGFFRKINPILFGIPFLCFLPRNGFTSQELYHYIWNFIQFRYLFHCRIQVLNANAKMYNNSLIDGSDNNNNNDEKQQQRMKTEYFDQFNNISNAYFQIFSGNMFKDKNNDNKNDGIWWRQDGNMHPPFVLRTVNKHGQACSQCTWDKYDIGCLVPYKSDDMGADYLDFDENNDFISIDWNEDFFNSFLMTRQDIIEKNKKEGKEEEKEPKHGEKVNEDEYNKAKHERFKGYEKELKLRGDMTVNTMKNGRKLQTNQATTFFNGMTLVFEEILEDASVKEHFSLYNKPISIGDCIREFQKEEKLSEYYCSNCDKKIDATKSLRIWSTPPILIMHLKRVGSMGRKIHTHVDYLLHNFDVSPFLVPRTLEPGQVLDDVIKEDEKIAAQQRELEEKEKEMAKQKEKEKESEKEKEKEKEDSQENKESDKNEKENGNENEREKKENKENEKKENILDKLEKKVNKSDDSAPKKCNNGNWKRYPVASSAQTHYNLFGAIQHYGAAGGGHYTAQCLCNDVNHKPNASSDASGVIGASSSNLGVGNSKKWYLFDDHRVRAISPLDVKSKNAYLLFYVRSDLQEIFFNKMNLMSAKMSQENENVNSNTNSNSNTNTNTNANVTSGNDNRKGKNRKEYENPSFNVNADELEQQFEFLPPDIQKLIGKELSEDEIKLLNSEGVESTRMRMKDCVIL